MKRLDLYYKKRGLFMIQSEGIDKGTSVTVYLPIEQEEEKENV